MRPKTNTAEKRKQKEAFIKPRDDSVRRGMARPDGPRGRWRCPWREPCWRGAGSTRGMCGRRVSFPNVSLLSFHTIKNEGEKGVRATWDIPWLDEVRDGKDCAEDNAKPADDHVRDAEEGVPTPHNGPRRDDDGLCALVDIRGELCPTVLAPDPLQTHLGKERRTYRR